MTESYITPGGNYYTLYKDMLDQVHILIAGATGSGKSVLINGIMHTALLSSPLKYQFVLIDLKRVELADYRDLPHTIAYADTAADAVSVLSATVDLIEKRYSVMQRDHVRSYQGSCVYVVIDELADLMTVAKKDVLPLIQRIAQIGRAANVKIIAATQCPLVTVIPTQVKVNFDTVIGLHTRSAQDSRNIIGVSGCELLPRYGQGYYMTPSGIERWEIPMYEDSERVRVLEHWRKQGKGKKAFSAPSKQSSAVMDVLKAAAYKKIQDKKVSGKDLIRSILFN